MTAKILATGKNILIMKGQLFSSILPASSSDVDVSMDDSHASAMSGMTADSMLPLPSPPRTQRRKQRTAMLSSRNLVQGQNNGGNCNINNNTVRSRLFDDEEEEDNHNLKYDNNNASAVSNEPGHRRNQSRDVDKNPSILKPIDLNLNFAEPEFSLMNNNGGGGRGRDIIHNSNVTTASSSAVIRSPSSGRLITSVHGSNTVPSSSSLTPHRPSRHSTIALRKRSAEQHDLYGKGWGFGQNTEDDDLFSVNESPVDMYASPRISPASPPGVGGRDVDVDVDVSTGTSSDYSNKSNCRMSIHRSPFLYGRERESNYTATTQTHKSPSSFQTIDGRTVQSKNPFSPMIFDETPTSTMGNSPALRQPILSVNDSLSFPASSLNGDGSNGGSNGSGTGGRGSHLVLRHKLQKRASSPSGVPAGNDQNQHHLRHPNIASTSDNTGMVVGIEMGGLIPPSRPSYKDYIPDEEFNTNNSRTNVNNNINNNNSNTSSINNKNDRIEHRASLYIRRDGYPEPTGRYSFTGSPIKEYAEPSCSSLVAAPSLTASATSSITEMSIKSKFSYDCCECNHNNKKDASSTNCINQEEMKLNDTSTEDVCTNIHKVRRRCKDDDVVAAASQGESSWKRNKMQIQTYDKNDIDSEDEWGFSISNKNGNNHFNNKNYYYSKEKSKDQADNISPTDVLNFPAPFFRASPTNKSIIPLAPSKPIRRPTTRRYIPIRKPIGPPPTPMPNVRKSRSFEEEDEDTSFLGKVNNRSYDDCDDNDSNSDSDDHGNAKIFFRRRRPKSSGIDYSNVSSRDSIGVGTQQFAMTQPSRFHSDFDVISELGSGSFGNVFQALSRLDGCMYAVKVAHRVAKGNADRDRMLKEVYALSALSDQADTATFHIVRYHQAWMEEQRLYIQTELCKTTLQAEIEEVSPMQLPLVTRYKFMREILLALEFIHKNGMVHLDIKPENIFVSECLLCYFFLLLEGFYVLWVIASYQCRNNYEQYYLTNSILKFY